MSDSSLARDIPRILLVLVLAIVGCGALAARRSPVPTPVPAPAAVESLPIRPIQRHATPLPTAATRAPEPADGTRSAK